MQQQFAYLPMLVSDDATLDAFLAGEIHLEAWIQQHEWDAAMLPYQGLLQARSDNPRLLPAACVAVDKVSINQVDRYARAFDFDQVMLDIANGAWVPLDARYLDLGPSAVVVTDPHELFKRIESVANRITPGYLRLEAGDLRYVSALSPVEYRDMYEAPAESSWRHGVRLALREGGAAQFLTATGDPLAPPEVVASAGDLHDICIKVRLADLVEGRFPDVLCSSDMFDKLAGQWSIGETIGVFCSFAGDVLEVEPTSEWIERVAQALPDGNWSARTVIEPVPEAETALPRLSFVEADQHVRLTIWSNRVEVFCTDATDAGRAMLFQSACAVAGMLHERKGAGFGWLRYSESIELERSPTGQGKHTFQYAGSVLEGGLLTERSLARGVCQAPNVFGFAEEASFLSCSCTVATGVADKTMWYLPQDVERFLNAASKRAGDFFREMRGGDPVERFLQLQRKDG